MYSSAFNLDAVFFFFVLPYCFSYKQVLKVSTLPCLNHKVFSFSHLVHYWLLICYIQTTLCWIVFLLNLTCLQFLLWRMLSLSNASSILTVMVIWFLLVLLMCFRFFHIESVLSPWDESHLLVIMLSDLFKKMYSFCLKPWITGGGNCRSQGNEVWGGSTSSVCRLLGPSLSEEAGLWAQSQCFHCHICFVVFHALITI